MLKKALPILAACLLVGGPLACTFGGKSPLGRVLDLDDSSSDSMKWAPHDVSILFPRAFQGPFVNKLIRLWWHVPGEQGTEELLPRQSFDQHFRSKFLVGGDRLYENLHLVGVRIDPEPCLAKDLPECEHPQMRLVFQSGLHDLSMHLVYSYSQDEFADLLSSFMEIKKQSPEVGESSVLGLHPGLLHAFKSQNTAYFDFVNSILLRFAKREHLSLAATSTGHSARGGSFWTFFAMKVEGFQFHPAPVLGAVDAHNNAQNYSPTAGNAESRTSPSSVPEKEFMPLLDRTAILKQRGQENRPFWEASLVSEDPTQSDITNTSCVNCHVSTQVRRELVKKEIDVFPEWRPQFMEDMSFDFSPTLSADTGIQNLRAFGYDFRGNVSINQRTINETALVIKHLNAAE